MIKLESPVKSAAAAEMQPAVKVEELNFFEKIWKDFLDFWKNLFSSKPEPLAEKKIELIEPKPPEPAAAVQAQQEAAAVDQVEQQPEDPSLEESEEEFEPMEAFTVSNIAWAAGKAAWSYFWRSPEEEDIYVPPAPKKPPLAPAMIQASAAQQEPPHPLLSNIEALQKTLQERGYTLSMDPVKKPVEALIEYTVTTPEGKSEKIVINALQNTLECSSDGIIRAFLSARLQSFMPKDAADDLAYKFLPPHCTRMTWKQSEAETFAFTLSFPKKSTSQFKLDCQTTKSAEIFTIASDETISGILNLKEKTVHCTQGLSLNNTFSVANLPWYIRKAVGFLPLSALPTFIQKAWTAFSDNKFQGELVLKGSEIGLKQTDEGLSVLGMAAGITAPVNQQFPVAYSWVEDHPMDAPLLHTICDKMAWA